VPEYFPRILEDDVFNAVQARLVNGSHRAGRTAKIENLFGGITKCGYCGARMDVVSKGKFPDEVRYLTCDSARRGFGTCNYVAFICSELETAFLMYCREQDVLEVLYLEGKQERAKCLKLAQQISSYEGELLNIDKQIALVDGDLADCTDKLERLHFRNKLTTMLHRKDEIQSAIASNQKEINVVNASANDAKQQIADILALFDHANKTLSESDRILFRTKLRNQLRQIVKKVVVYPRGQIYNDKAIEAAMSKYDLNGSDAEVQYMRQTQNNTKDDRFFIVHFKNGNYRYIKYCPDAKTYQVTMDRVGGTVDWWQNGIKMKPLVRENSASQIQAGIDKYREVHPDTTKSNEEIDAMIRFLSGEGESFPDAS